MITTTNFRQICGHFCAFEGAYWRPLGLFTTCLAHIYYERFHSYDGIIICLGAWTGNVVIRFRDGGNEFRPDRPTSEVAPQISVRWHDRNEMMNSLSERDSVSWNFFSLYWQNSEAVHLYRVCQCQECLTFRYRNYQRLSLITERNFCFGI